MKKTTSSVPTLSVVIPAYNEAQTIRQVVAAVRNSPVSQIEIIVVDDGSTDGTRQILKDIRSQIDLVILREKNGGKGAALRDGFQAAKGQIVLIQDADLEYDPRDYTRLLQPILEERADVVYGSRFVGSQPHRVVYFSHYLANMMLTCLSNFFNNLNLSDMETGYKAFRSEVIKKITLEENGFGIEPELTAKVAAQKIRLYEVGIGYYGRTYEDGKKIGLRDFFWAIWIIVKYGVNRWF